MSLLVNYRSVADKQRKMTKFIDQLKTSDALERLQRQRIARRARPPLLLGERATGVLGERPAGVGRTQGDPLPYGQAPLRPSLSKDQMTEQDAYNELLSRLGPFMFNNQETVAFLERIRGRLRDFLDTFGLFAKDYLVGVSRLTAPNMMAIYDAFVSRKLQPQP